MPLIEEVLATIPPGRHRRLFIELKVGADAAAPLVAVIQTSGKPAAHIAVISFSFDTCAEVKRLMPELNVYFLSDMRADDETGTPAPTIDELIRRVKAAKLDGLDLSYKGSLDAAWLHADSRRGAEMLRLDGRRRGRREETRRRRGGRHHDQSRTVDDRALGIRSGQVRSKVLRQAEHVTRGGRRPPSPA
jgi:hypothetical protein